MNINYDFYALQYGVYIKILTLIDSLLKNIGSDIFCIQKYLQINSQQQNLMNIVTSKLSLSNFYQKIFSNEQKKKIIIISCFSQRGNIFFASGQKLLQSLSTPPTLWTLCLQSAFTPFTPPNLFIKDEHTYTH